MHPFFLNGKPYHIKGFLNQFTKIVKRNKVILKKLGELNVPIIGVDPSITLTYRDEYNKIDGNENFKILLPQEFLQNYLINLQPLKNHKTFYLLTHCTEKTTHISAEKEWQKLFSALGLTLIPLSVGCCGMAGAYGHEQEHISYSHALYNLSWKKHLVDIKDPMKYVLATGYSCRSQVQRMHQIKLQHPLRALLNEIKEQS